MKTAVEWLYEKILLTPLDIREINKCLEQAKEMEKNISEKYSEYRVKCAKSNIDAASFKDYIISYKFLITE